MAGPSPRAWGLVPPARPGVLAERSIPTCVGLGGPCRRRRRTKPVHPHVRGAWRTCDSNTTTSPGPSPRAWGLAPCFLFAELDLRSIPTCGGLGTAGRPARPRPPVHPHVRGAWLDVAVPLAHGRGPSPRAWGLGANAQELYGVCRSIPTCVGLGLPCRASP